MQRRNLASYKDHGRYKAAAKKIKTNSPEPHMFTPWLAWRDKQLAAGRVYVHCRVCRVPVWSHQVCGLCFPGQKNSSRVYPHPGRQTVPTCTGHSNRTGLPGVTCVNNRFVAQIRINGKRVYLGCFGTAEEASAAWKKAAEDRDKCKSYVKMD